MHPSSGTARWCKLPRPFMKLSVSGGVEVPCVLHTAFVFATEHVHLSTYRERNSFWDSGSGQGSAAHTLGADGLWSAVHGVAQVPHHHAHRPVSTSCAGQGNKTTKCYDSALPLSVLLLSRYFLTSFYTKYDRIHFVINTISLMSVLIPKLPQFHGVRIFGINKYWVVWLERMQEEQRERGMFLLSSSISSSPRRLGCNFTAAV